jgi:hypothetical protein
MANGGGSRRPWWSRLLVSLAAGMGWGVLAAIVLTIIDLYLAGHGRRPLNAPLIDVDWWGIHLSVADLLFLTTILVGTLMTWRRTAGR